MKEREKIWLKYLCSSKVKFVDKSGELGSRVEENYFINLELFIISGSL